MSSIIDTTCEIQPTCSVIRYINIYSQQLLFYSPHLLLCALSHVVFPRRVLWLQLQQSPKEVFWGDRETLELGVGMEAVQRWVLRGEMFIDVSLIAIVVWERRSKEPQAQKELSFKLKIEQKQMMVKLWVRRNLRLHKIHRCLFHWIMTHVRFQKEVTCEWSSW